MLIFYLVCTVLCTISFPLTRETLQWAGVTLSQVVFVYYLRSACEQGRMWPGVLTDDGMPGQYGSQSLHWSTRDHRTQAASSVKWLPANQSWSRCWSLPVNQVIQRLHAFKVLVFSESIAWVRGCMPSNYYSSYEWGSVPSNHWSTCLTVIISTVQHQVTSPVTSPSTSLRMVMMKSVLLPHLIITTVTDLTWDMFLNIVTPTWDNVALDPSPALSHCLTRLLGNCSERKERKCWEETMIGEKHVPLQYFVRKSENCADANQQFYNVYTEMHKVKLSCLER